MPNADAQDIRALRRALQQAGVFERTPVAFVAKFGLHAIVGAALFLSCLQATPLWAALLVPPTALVWIVAVMMGHEATHLGAFRSRRANAVFRNIAFPFMSGMSGLFWRYKHNILHHRHPNVIGEDEDLEMLPLAVGRAYHLGATPRDRWIQRHLQRGVLLWGMTLFLPWDLRLRSVRYLWSAVRANGITREWAIDVAMIACHWLVFLVVPALVFGPLRAVSVELGVWIVAGGYLGVVGLVGHTAMPLIDKYDDDWALQFHTTRNIALGPILSWWFVGLDYQIEHHLFPSVSQFKLKAAAPMVKQYAEAHGLPYVRQSLQACLRDVTSYVDEAWNDPALDLAGRALGPAIDRSARPTWGRLRPHEYSRPDAD